MKKMTKLILISAFLFIISCDRGKGLQCNYKAGWDEGRNDYYMSQKEVERLNADCRKTRDEYHEEMLDRRQ